MSTADRAAARTDLTGRVAVITGANSGLGLHTAEALAAAGASVVLACRDPQRGEAARATVAHAATAAEPTYGGQLQDHAVAGLKAEGRVGIAYEPVPVKVSGGGTVTLRKPELKISNLAYGPLDPATMMSVRVAPPMIGCKEPWFFNHMAKVAGVPSAV